MPRSHLIPSSLIGAGVIALALAPSGPASAAVPLDPYGFSDTVTADAVLERLERFQEIADANGGNRAAGTSGYEASGAYVEQVLQEAGYETERQYFETTVQDIAAATLTVEGVALDPAGVPLEFTPSTDPVSGVTGRVVAPNPPAEGTGAGCSAADWEGVDATGAVALVQRGVCPFAQKSAEAAAAGAVGVIIFNNSEDANEPLNGTLGAAPGEYAPGFGVSRAQGEAILAALAADPELTATLAIDQSTETIETFNVITQTPTGNPDNVVMLGAHLDSVPEGAGINDNGSGSAAILETAVQLASAGELTNAVRFAWWGAEEIGLVGSTEYVYSLEEEEIERIATYLNFDMVGSPNYIIGVYDADESTYEAPVEVPAGSIETEDVFTDYFDAIGQPWVDTEFSGRSDYQAFIENDIPASGLFTGADDVKTEEEVALFGGTAGITHDPNYHSAEDDISNIDEDALAINAAAIGFATASLANDTSAINGEGAPEEPAVPAVPAAPAGQPDGTTTPGMLPSTGAEPLPLLGAGSLILLAGAAVLASARRRARPDATR